MVNSANANIGREGYIFQPEQLKALKAIIKITDDGDNAEVRSRNGKLSILKVKKNHVEY